MAHNKPFNEYGPGDEETWPPCNNDCNDPRTPETDEEIEAWDEYFWNYVRRLKEQRKKIC